MARLLFVDIPYRVIYLKILFKLRKYNCIAYYTITDKYTIRVYFQYYKGRPICFLRIVSKISDKKYYKNKFLKKNQKRTSNYIYSTDLGFLNYDELLFKKVGGLGLIKIEFLSRNIN